MWTPPPPLPLRGVTILFCKFWFCKFYLLCPLVEKISPLKFEKNDQQEYTSSKLTSLPIIWWTSYPNYPLLIYDWLLKACVCFFSSDFYFSTKWESLKDYEKYFFSSKKLFSFSRYSIFCNFFPSFPNFQDYKGQMDVE